MAEPADRPVEPYAGVVARAALWLAFLAPFFYLTYGFANGLAARQDNVGSIVYGWERHVPFMAWTIVPYWSINLFYGLSLLLNRTKGAVDRLAGRYLTAQLVAVSCFILFPLTATFERPETSGLPGFLFAVLGGFDKPFNQAPSLHIALLVIIWDHWRHRLSGAPELLWHVWCFLIGASVLTTWQHHFIDIPSGALLGFFALWLFPREGELPFAAAKLARSSKARRLAGLYTVGAVALLGGAGIGAYRGAPSWLILLWPSLSLAIVAFGYGLAGPKVFQKGRDGSVSLASRVLLWPYRLGARVNAWAWTRRLAPHAAAPGGVSFGRFPTAVEANAFSTVIDLAAEFERPPGVTAQWLSLPMTDLVPAKDGQAAAAVEAIERARPGGPVLVCCRHRRAMAGGVGPGRVGGTGAGHDLRGRSAGLFRPDAD